MYWSSNSCPIFPPILSIQLGSSACALVPNAAPVLFLLLRQQARVGASTQSPAPALGGRWTALVDTRCCPCHWPAPNATVAFAAAPKRLDMRPTSSRARYLTVRPALSRGWKRGGLPRLRLAPRSLHGLHSLNLSLQLAIQFVVRHFAVLPPKGVLHPHETPTTLCRPLHCGFASSILTTPVLQSAYCADPPADEWTR